MVYKDFFNQILGLPSGEKEIKIKSRQINPFSVPVSEEEIEKKTLYRIFVIILMAKIS